MAQSKREQQDIRRLLLSAGHVHSDTDGSAMRTVNKEASMNAAIASRRAEMGIRHRVIAKKHKQVAS